MIRDPLYRDIVAGLQRPLDGDLFEHCAAALLKPLYPTLVPIRGGSDHGMDGSVATGDGPPHPLICTTSTDVIGNFTASLDRYVAEGGAARRVISVTSQNLTAKRRQNLEKRAAEKRFELVQIHDQTDLALRLYGDPVWCRELLGVAGDRPALSVVPVTTRPHVGDVLVGRDSDVDWLADPPEDRVLVGQPGMGKTFVLRSVVMNGWGLFVVDEDIGRIRDALRAEKPGILVVDDAHVRIDLLAQLRQLRDHTGADFYGAATKPGSSMVRGAKELGSAFGTGFNDEGPSSYVAIFGKSLMATISSSCVYQ